MDFSGKKLLITGGTGSFGNTILKVFLNTNIEEIRILSRDEKKQDDLRKKFNSPKLKLHLGDVRDFSSVRNAVSGVNYIFHAAALKQVPNCEFFPMEAIKTNVLGTENVLEAAISSGVEKVICLSTDKAVYPINAMGLSKAMMEKIMVAKSRGLDDNKIVLCGTRYGNVMASRGSVIPLFIDQIRTGKPITITDPLMTRFMMSLDDAVSLVLFAFKNAKNGDIFVQKAPAATVEILARALAEMFGVPNHPIHIIGSRHGEKVYETLLSREERASSQDLGDYFRIVPDTRDLNYKKYLDEGEIKISNSEDYNSHNTNQLNINNMKELLFKLDYIQETLKGINVEIL